MSPAESSPNHSSRATNALVGGILSNWVMIVVLIVYSLTITPVVVHSLGSEQYGVWTFLNGLLVYTDLLYLGLGASLVKGIAERHAANDLAGLNRLASVVLTIYSAVGIACFLALAGASRLVPRLLAGTLSPDTARAAVFATLLLGARVMVLFVASVFSGIMYGREWIHLHSGVRLVVQCGLFLAVPLAVSAPDPLLRLAVVTVASSVAEAAGFIILTFRFQRGLRVRLVMPRRSEIARLYGFGLQSFLMLLSFKLLNYTDTTLIGAVLGASSVTLYSLPLQLIEYTRVAISGLTSVLLPRLAILQSTGDKAALRDAYLRVTRVACFVAALLGANIMMLGAPFLSLWVGPEFGGTTWILVCLTVASVAQALSIQVPVPFYQALSLLTLPSLMILVEAVANLSLSYVLAKRFGVTGVAVGTMIPALCVGALLLPRYLCKNLELPLSSMFVKSLVPALTVFVAVVALQGVLDLVVANDSYMVFAAKGTMSLAVAVGVAAAVFPRDERYFVMSWIRRLAPFGTI